MDPLTPTPVVRRLDGRTVLVTGAASGIGRATAVRAAAEGARVAAWDLDPQGLEGLASELSQRGATVRTQLVDVSQEDRVSAAVAEAAGELGGLHGVVTCAGIVELSDHVRFGDAPLDAFVRNLTVNLVGTFLPVKHAIRHLVQTRGAVVTVGSISAILGNGRGAGYTASKGGVIALSRLVAAQYAKAGVRVNCVCPGGVMTPMAEKLFPDPDAAEKVAQVVPIRRAAQPEEIASAIAFLLSDDASFMTGSTVVIDGGMTIV